MSDLLALLGFGDAPVDDRVSKAIYPTARVRLHILLENLGQDSPEELLRPITVAPVMYRVELNPPYEADTFEVEIHSDDFPYDPRIVRGATIEVLQADAGDKGLDPSYWDTWDAGDHGPGRYDYLDEDEPSRITRRRYALIVGVVDHLEIGWGDDGEWKCVLKGRDYTAFFLDSQPAQGDFTYTIDGQPPNDSNKLSLQEIVQMNCNGGRTFDAPGTVIEADPRTEKIEVVTGDPDYNTGPVFGLPAETGETVPVYPADHINLLKSGKPPKRNTRSTESRWDVFQELALTTGRIIYVDRDMIVIRHPRTLYFREDPVTGQPVQREQVFRFDLGDNLKTYRVARNMGRIKNVFVKVISSYSKGKQRLSVTYPDPEDQSTGSAAAAEAAVAARLDVSASAVGDEQDSVEPPTKTLSVKVFVVRNVADADVLMEIAKSAHDQLVHHELEAEFETDEMYDVWGRHVNYLRHGTLVDVRVAESLIESAAAMNPSKLIEHLAEQEAGGVSMPGGKGIGMKREDAEKIADALENRNRIPFYVHRATHTYRNAEGEGYSLHVELRSKKQVTVTAKAVIEKEEATEGQQKVIIIQADDGER